MLPGTAALLSDGVGVGVGVGVVVIVGVGVSVGVGSGVDVAAVTRSVLQQHISCVHTPPLHALSPASGLDTVGALHPENETALSQNAIPSPRSKDRKFEFSVCMPFDNSARTRTL
jgi:hypothetical protein